MTDKTRLQSFVDKVIHTMGNLLHKHWLNIATMMVSLVAVALAYQSNVYSREANEIAREASTSKMMVIENPADWNEITIRACSTKDSARYSVQHNLFAQVTLINSGGRPAALIGVEVDVAGEDPYYATQIVDREPLELPITLEPARGIRLSIYAHRASIYMTESEALQAIAEKDGENTPVTWRFRFSDESTVTQVIDGYYSTIGAKIDFTKICS